MHYKTLVSLIVFVGFTGLPVLAQTATVELTPTQDTFTRGPSPESSHGAAEEIHVSGSDARNFANVPQGVAEAWIQFDASVAVAEFDAQFGVGQWRLSSATLNLIEIGEPEDGTLSAGVGGFGVDWVANDDWAEGDGTPSAPGNAQLNILGFTTGQELRDEASDESLGDFANAGADGPLQLELALPTGFSGDITGGELVTLNILATDDGTGFTFYASNRVIESEDATQQPILTLMATGSLLGGGGGNGGGTGGGQAPGVGCGAMSMALIWCAVGLRFMANGHRRRRIA